LRLTFASLENESIIDDSTEEIVEELPGVERLLNRIFKEKNYNNLVRPRDKQTGLTYLQTELKLLQLDLVVDYFILILF